jgi:hypothetical protein
VVKFFSDIHIYGKMMYIIRRGRDSPGLIEFLEKKAKGFID